MNDYDGAQRIIYVTAASAGAGATAITLRPDQGKVWVVQHAVGRQTTGGARTLDWTFTDPIDSRSLISLSVNSGSHLSWDAAAADTRGLAQGQLVLTRDRYLTLTMTATGAAENVFIKAMVREFKGAS